MCTSDLNPPARTRVGVSGCVVLDPPRRHAEAPPSEDPPWHLDELLDGVWLPRKALRDELARRQLHPRAKLLAAGQPGAKLALELTSLVSGEKCGKGRYWRFSAESRYALDDPRPEGDQARAARARQGEAVPDLAPQGGNGFDCGRQGRPGAGYRHERDPENELALLSGGRALQNDHRAVDDRDLRPVRAGSRSRSTRPSAGSRSSPSRSRAPAADAATRSRCATRTRSPAAPPGPATACDLDSGSPGRSGFRQAAHAGLGRARGALAAVAEP
jgi:hypothetical protein